MQIAVAVAGFTMGEADVLRKAMGKKNAEVMAKQKEKFLSGAEKRGVARKKAQELWDYIEPFAGYGFNKSHSVAYAYLAYKTAYLKAHYPVAFMAAMLTSEISATDEIVKYVVGVPRDGDRRPAAGRQRERVGLQRGRRSHPLRAGRGQGARRGRGRGGPRGPPALGWLSQPRPTGRRRWIPGR